MTTKYQGWIYWGVCIMTTKYQGWIYWGVAPPPSHGQRVCRGGYFHDKAKNIRDKMSNLSNNMMISKLLTTITIEIQ